VMFHRFHFLKVTKEIESFIITSLITCFLGQLVAWVDLGGGDVTTFGGFNWCSSLFGGMLENNNINPLYYNQEKDLLINC